MIKAIFTFQVIEFQVDSDDNSTIESSFNSLRQNLKKINLIHLKFTSSSKIL